MQNEVIISGTLKNIKFAKNRDNRVNGWLNQRAISALPNGEHDRMVYVCGINITARDADVIKDLVALDNARQGQPETMPVTIKGRLTTWIRKSQTDTGKDEFVQQVEVFEVITN
jgi:hypothetical protein